MIEYEEKLIERNEKVFQEILEYNNNALPSSYIKRDNSVSWYLDKYSAILLS